MRVYLAGGTHSGWQERVIEALEGVECHNPATLRGMDPDEVADTERHWLRHADLVLAYFEATNPLGHGMAAEMGMAAGLGIPVLYVNKNHPKFAWLGHFTGAQPYEDLEAAVAAIKIMGGCGE